MGLPVKLYASDDMIVKGSYYQVSGGITEETEKTLDCMELDFTVRVNGRLCSFTESFMIGTYLGEPSVSEWSNWYLAVRILHAFGYRFEGEKEVEETTGILKRFVSRMMNEVPAGRKIVEFEYRDIDPVVISDGLSDGSD